MIVSGTASIPSGAVTARVTLAFHGLYTAKITGSTPLGWFPVVDITSKDGHLDLAWDVPAPDDATLDWMVNR